MKRFLWILLLIVLVLSACDGSDGSDVTTEAPQLSDEVQTFDDNPPSSDCPYDIAQIQRELENTAKIARPYVSGSINLSYQLAEKMQAAQNVLGDPNCTQEITQFKIRETLQLANISQVIVNAENCYSSAIIADKPVEPCYQKLQTGLHQVCPGTIYEEWCESLDDLYRGRR